MKSKTFTNCIYFLILLSITFIINYNVRAYNAIGGEIFIIPIVYMIKYLVAQYKSI